MSARLTLAIHAETAADAREAARMWARAEPRLRLRRIVAVRPRVWQWPDVIEPWGVPTWLVELAVEYVAEKRA